jgi:hypothetical protein
LGSPREAIATGLERLPESQRQFDGSLQKEGCATSMQFDERAEDRQIIHPDSIGEIQP